MKIYVFGNQNIPDDNLAFKVAEKLSHLPNIEYIFRIKDFGRGVRYIFDQN